MTSKSSLKNESQFLIVLMALSYLSSLLIFLLFEDENPHIKSIGDISWWWVVTSSTVGYGDIVPYTIPGRIFGTLVIVVGIFGYTYTVSLILNRVTARLSAKERGKAPIVAENHVLICEYTAFADEMLQELPQSSLKDKDVVLLTSLVDRSPYKYLQFVYGVPISPQALKNAHADKATHIFVFSNNRFFEPDSKTLHVVSRIMQLNPSAQIFVELMNPENELLSELPRNVTIMPSDRLLHAALQQKNIQLESIVQNAVKSA